MSGLKAINTADLVPMDLFAADFPLRVDVVYATPASFCGPVYRPGARLTLHRDLAEIVLAGSLLLQRRRAGRLVLYDGLRTTDAQLRMRDTPVVKANPQWLEGETRLLSPPGLGGHPRGMAIDLSIEDAQGALLDMGTPFDMLSPLGGHKDVNRAHREHEGLPAPVLENRALLTDVLLQAAALLERPLLPLPSEWWDYRLPGAVSGMFAPLSDADLPPALRVTDEVPEEEGARELPPGHYQALAWACAEKARALV